ncbi:hypothetical protein ACJBZX_11585, partial [Streptococcus suis]
SHTTLYQTSSAYGQLVAQQRELEEAVSGSERTADTGADSETLAVHEAPLATDCGGGLLCGLGTGGVQCYSSYAGLSGF